MAHLARAKKVDLMTLVRELNLEAQEGSTKNELVEKIVKMKNYDEELTKNYLLGIVSEREEIEKKEIEKNAREYELKKLELELRSKNQMSLPDSTGIGKVKNNNLLKLMTRYETEQDISIYLTLFERQIARAEIPEEDWVSYLLTLLPLEMVDLAAREPDPQANEYPHIKNLLLQRFKLSAEQFRQKFFSHKKESIATWRDYAFEITNYFEQWLAGLEIKTFNELKSLIIVDQIKRKLPHEIRDHFLDSLAKIKDADSFVALLDDYEQARSNVRKDRFDARNFGPETRRRNIRDSEKNVVHNNRGNQDKYTRDIQGRGNAQNGPRNGLKCFNCGQNSHLSFSCPRKKEGIICRRCNKSGHFSDQCPIKEVNKIVDKKREPSPNKISKTVKLGDKLVESILDTGSDSNLVSYDVYVDIGSPKLHFDETKFVGISGTQVNPLGYFYSKIGIDQYEINCKIYVMRILSDSLILGRDILKKFDLELTDGSFTITSRKESAKNGNFTEIPRCCNKPLKINKTGSNNLNVGICRIVRCDAENEQTESELYDEIGNSRGNSVLGKRVSQQFNRSLDENEFQLIAKSFQAVDGDENKINLVINRDIGMRLLELIQNYRPDKTKTTNVKLKDKADLNIKKLLEEEITDAFVLERENNRAQAKENILKIQEENKRCYNKKRKKATQYNIGDLVAIQRTQFAGGLKLRAKFFGPYRVIKRRKHNRYDVEKVGNHEGPINTSSAADYMKPWSSE